MSDLSNPEAKKHIRESHSTSPASELLRKDSDIHLSAVNSKSEERSAQERAEFNERLHKQNIEFSHIHPGWGPYQELQKDVKEKKIELSDEQLLSEARRMRDRDFHDFGRTYYRTGDRTQLFSDKEIAQKLEEMVNRPKGIDVSYYQGNIDWSQVKEAGYQFAFIKASEGITIVDPKLEQNRAGARAAGVPVVGFYHLFRPNDSVDQQVKTFVNAVGKSEHSPLRLVVDLEIPSIWKPYSVQQRVNMIDDWCQKVNKELGVKPGVTVYGSPSFFTGLLKSSPKLAAYDLWLADYNSGDPPTPKPWNNWTFWQYTKSKHVPGIKGFVDLDVYNDTAFGALSKPTERR